MSAQSPIKTIAQVTGLQAQLDAIRLHLAGVTRLWSITGAGDSTTLGVTSAQWGYKLLGLLGESTPTVGKFTPWYGGNFVPDSLMPTQSVLAGWTNNANIASRTVGSAASLDVAYGANEVTITAGAGGDGTMTRTQVVPTDPMRTVSWWVRKADGSAVTNADCQAVTAGTAKTASVYTRYGATTWYRMSFSGASSAGATDYYGICVKAGKSVIVCCPQWETASAPTAYKPTQDRDWNRKLTGMVWTFYNAARGGASTTTCSQDFAENVLGHTSDFDNIYIGLNSIIGNVAAATIAGLIEGMAASSVASGRIPIVCTITPWGLGTEEQRNNIDATNVLIRAFCAEHGYTLCDLCKAFDPTHTQHAATLQNADELHPNEAGHAVIAQAVFDALSVHLI